MGSGGLVGVVDVDGRLVRTIALPFVLLLAMFGAVFPEQHDGFVVLSDAIEVLIKVGFEFVLLTLEPLFALVGLLLLLLGDVGFG